MKLVYSPSANQSKQNIICQYSGINIYFEKLEKQIVAFPAEAAEERGIIEGMHITAYKKSVKTGLFSGNFINSFLYLSSTYIIDESKQRIIVIGIYLKTYPS